MRTSPNFEKTKINAYKTLEQLNIRDFPIDFLSIFSSYDDLKVITYTEMAKKRKCSVKEVIEANSSEDGVIHYCAKRKKYMIVYNDQVDSKERIYWTLAHEFGHYILKHHKESDRSVLTRNNINIDELDVFEVEANFFARHFVTPPPLIVEGKLNHYTKVMEFFGVSFTAANNTLKYMKDSFEKGFRFNFPFDAKAFYNKFIAQALYGKTCNVCNAFSYIKGLKFCLICGNDSFHIFYKGDNIDMIYSSFELDDEMRVTQCPRCENEDVSGNYCKVCAEYLFNICTGYDDSDNSDHSGLYWHEHEHGCGTSPLDGNARYCHECGSTSSFFEEGLLKLWDNKPNEEKQLVDTGGNPVEISDDDLPF